MPQAWKVDAAHCHASGLGGGHCPLPCLPENRGPQDCLRASASTPSGPGLRGPFLPSVGSQVLGRVRGGPSGQAQELPGSGDAQGTGEHRAWGFRRRGLEQKQGQKAGARWRRGRGSSLCPDLEVGGVRALGDAGRGGAAGPGAAGSATHSRPARGDSGPNSSGETSSHTPGTGTCEVGGQWCIRPRRQALSSSWWARVWSLLTPAALRQLPGLQGVGPDAHPLPAASGHPLRGVLHASSTPPQCPSWPSNHTCPTSGFPKWEHPTFLSTPLNEFSPASTSRQPSWICPDFSHLP